MTGIILIRGGGDLASGVALRLKRAGMRILITELEQPLVVRRLVSFAQAVFNSDCQVEEATGRLVADVDQAETALGAGEIPVMIDPQASVLQKLKPVALVDARMTKRPPETRLDTAEVVIGLGPGFIAGENCQAVIETKRGHTLGKVIWQGAPIADSGAPGSIERYSVDRVLRAPATGELIAHAQICDHLNKGDLIAEVAGVKVEAPFEGVLRGLLYPGLIVPEGLKIGDLDPRIEVSYCTTVSDKALAIGGGVLEALLSRPEIRALLWD